MLAVFDCAVPLYSSTLLRHRLIIECLKLREARLKIDVRHNQIAGVITLTYRVLDNPFDKDAS